MATQTKRREYTIGALSETLASKIGSKKKLIKENDKTAKKLKQLFESPAQKETSLDNTFSANESWNIKKFKTVLQPTTMLKRENADKDDKKPSKRKKKSLTSLESHTPGESVLKVTSPPVHQKGYNPPPGIVHEALLKQDRRSHMGSKADQDKDISGEEDHSDTERRQKKKTPRDISKDSRTVFVGNLPVSTDKKALMKLFRKFGQIQSVRFRCPPPADLKLPKRVITIQKKFHPERSNIIAFVCFLEESSAQKALKKDGKLVDGCHIHVDLASNEKQHDHQRSIFVGNLPFDVSEEQVRNHFEKCGNVKNVRIIRDNRTGLGKGFCYVLFESKDSVFLAMKLNDSELEGRKLRVLRSQENPTKGGTENRKISDRNSGKFSGNTKKKTKGSFEGMRSDVGRKKDKRFKKKKNVLTKNQNRQNAMKRLEGKTKGSKKKSLKR